MKLRSLFSAALILAAAVLAAAQSAESKVAKIRQLYVGTVARVAIGIEDKSSGLHHAAMTVGGEKDGQQWRSVGKRNQTTEFYFNCEPGDPECPGDVRRLLVQIVGDYQAGSSITSRFIYLFDNKGDLIYALTTDENDEGKPEDCRLYFANKQLIRISRRGKNVDARFSAADLQKSRDEAAEAKRLQNLFALMFAE